MMAKYFRARELQLLCFLTFASLNLSTGEVQEASVFKHEDGTFSVSPGIDKTGVAYGSYNNTLFQTGWGELHLFAGYSTGNKAHSDRDRMYAAGILEGALTAKQISQNLQNINSTFFSPDGNPELWARVVDFFTTQDTWMREMIKERANDDPFWEGVALVLSQFDGLIMGYKMSGFSNATSEDGFLAMQVLNSCGDLIDLKNALMPSLIPDWDKLTKKEILRFVSTSGHCSALIKVLPAFEDVFMSHSSWFTYSATLRIYKHYHFKLDFEGNAAEVTSFSSYPGFLESLDDFYIMSSGLSMLQTTNNVFNKTLYKFVQPQSLLAWQRVRVANMMARSGKQWADIVARYNSGTYNNQYMIIDRTKIKPKIAILDDALWVVEQVPTIYQNFKSRYDLIHQGYWPSYNVPFYEEIYNISGYPEQVKKVGSDMTYQLAPRAKIFRRDQGKVTDMESFKKIMRFNDYKNDPYSEGDPSKSICMRGDLMTDPIPDGCYDTKVTNLAMAAKQTSYVINGPTRGDGSLPPFQWAAPFTSWSHVGLPTLYDFSFVEMCPKEL
nr:phospholipase B-like 1 [Lytechinus pictus]